MCRTPSPTALSPLPLLPYESGPQTASPGLPQPHAFQELVEHSAAGLVIIQGGGLVYCNPRAAEIFGCPNGNIAALPLSALFHEADHPTVNRYLRHIEAGEIESAGCTARGRHADGHAVHLELRGVRGEHDGRPAVIGTVFDVSARELAGNRLRERERHYRLLAENMTDLVVLHGPDGTYEWASPSVEPLLGYTPEDLIGRSPYDLFHPDEVEGLLEVSHMKLLGGEEPVTTLTHRFLHKDGRYIWLESQTRLILDHMGGVSRLQTTAREVTDRVEMEAKLRRQACYDTLTGLPNRHALLEQIADLLLLNGTTEGPLLLCVDLDRFKAVNDALGHVAADRVLQEVAGRLQALAPPGGTAARIGGDQFALLLPASEAGGEASHVREALRAPLVVASHDLRLTVSVGVVSLRADHPRPEAVLREAEAAMYEAKTSAWGVRVVRTASDLGDVSQQLRLEMDLRHAVDRGELRVVYQPVVRLADGGLTGFEALVRWEHPELGLLAPGAFIEAAERSGQITDIDRWVLGEVGHQLGEWASSGGRADPFTVNVNCTGRDLLEANYVDGLRRTIARLAGGPYRLALELTESLLVEDVTAVATELQSLQAAGVRVCVDDFGTGYSSLQTIQALPADTLKVDRSFVHTMTTDGKSYELVRAVVELGGVLGKSVVAEGVESDDQLAALRQMGATYGQGYLFGKPLSPETASMFATGRELTPFA